MTLLVQSSQINTQVVQIFHLKILHCQQSDEVHTCSWLFYFSFVLTP